MSRGNETITHLLTKVADGDFDARNQLFEAVYRDLKRLAASRMAREGPGHTLQTTALVHEGFMRLAAGQNLNFNCRRHFFFAAGEAMRRILIERARRGQRLKHGGHLQRVDIDPKELGADLGSEQLLLLDEALSRLEKIDTDMARTVILRFFVGLSLKEVAEKVGMSERSVSRQWTAARAFLHAALKGEL